MRKFFCLENEDSEKQTLLLGKEAETEYDDLFFSAKQKTEQTVSDETENAEADPEKNDDDAKSDEENVDLSMESSISLYYCEELALEGEVFDKIKSKLSSGFKNLSEKFSLMVDKLMVAVNAGTESIVKYVAKRFESFNRLKNRLVDFQKVLEELKKTDPSVPGETVFTNKDVIYKITSSKDADPISAFDSYLSFFNKIGKNLYSNLVKAVEQVRLMIGQCLSDPESLPVKYLKFTGSLSDMKEQILEGYYPPDGTVSFVGPLLPGNLALVAHVPKNEDDVDVLRKANRDSRVLLAKVDNYGKPPDKLKYYKVSELEAFVSVMLDLVNIGYSQVEIYKDINKIRESLAIGFKGYARKILTKKDFTGKEPVDLIATKFAAIDQMFISGLMAMHTNSVNLTENGLHFCKQNAKVLAS